MLNYLLSILDDTHMRKYTIALCVSETVQTWE